MPTNETTARTAAKAEAAKLLSGAPQREALIEVLVLGQLLVLQQLRDMNGGEAHEKAELDAYHEQLQSIADALHGG